jgi:hypothetical protein
MQWTIKLEFTPDGGGTIDTLKLLREIAFALGWNEDQRPFYRYLTGLWIHAGDRELLGWKPCRAKWDRSWLFFYVKWGTAGWAILGLLAIWRAHRFVRWLSRIGPRRRAWKAVHRLGNSYKLLAAYTVSMRELRRVIEDARGIFGSSSVLGGDFWCVLDDVCARHPINLNASLRVT